MATRSFLSAIGRYLPSEKITPTENLLTEWLAECLRQCDRFRGAFGRLSQKCPSQGGNAATGGESWDLESVRDTKVITQTKVGGFIPDLQISFKDQGREALVFVEVKWDAAEGSDQLDRYHTTLQELASRGSAKGPHVLVYLTKPSHELPKTDFPYVAISWTDVWRAAEDCLQGEAENSKSHFLLTQLSHYLKEKNMDEIELSDELLGASKHAGHWMRIGERLYRAVTARECKEPAKKDYPDAKRPRAITHSKAFQHWLFNQGALHDRLIYWDWLCEPNGLDMYFGILLGPEGTRYHDAVLPEHAKGSGDSFADALPLVVTMIGCPQDSHSKEEVQSFVQRVCNEPEHLDHPWTKREGGPTDSQVLCWRLRPVQEFRQSASTKGYIEDMANWIVDGIEVLCKTGILDDAPTINKSDERSSSKSP